MSSDKLERYLEANGWTRAVAGDADFDAAVGAIQLMIDTGRGIVIAGEYGVGKTALAKIIAKGFRIGFAVRLAVPSDREKLTPWWRELYAEDPFGQGVFLDDLGAEPLTNEYGVKYELAGDFIVEYHARATDSTRLVVTTNLTTGELDARYGGRVLSRLKDLCVPLRLSGKDKRQWAIPQTTTSTKGI